MHIYSEEKGKQRNGPTTCTGEQNSQNKRLPKTVLTKHM